MNELRINIGEVVDIENEFSTYIKDDKHKNDRPFDGLRIRAKLPYDDTNDKKHIPWAFPLLPKSFQSIPQIGESVLVFNDGSIEGQRYYIGPIISQPQFNSYAPKKLATSLLDSNEVDPLGMVSNNPDTTGSFPKSSDVALVGRGLEDIILRANGTSDSSNMNNVNESEILLRTGVRTEPLNDPNPNMIGNIIFNGIDPAYIQLKYMKGLTGKRDQEANSIINLVANRINIMSNKDDDIAHNIRDNECMIPNDKMDDIMSNLHPVPKGDDLVYLLNVMKMAILGHVHPWAGMQQCGDWGGYVKKLEDYDPNTILSKYVRIS